MFGRPRRSVLGTVLVKMVVSLSLPPVFPHGAVCPGHLAERWPTWPRIPKAVGRPMGGEMSRRSHLPSGCEATTCRARISRGGGGRVSVMTMEPGA